MGATTTTRLTSRRSSSSAASASANDVLPAPGVAVTRKSVAPRVAVGLQRLGLPGAQRPPAARGLQEGRSRARSPYGQRAPARPWGAAGLCSDPRRPPTGPRPDTPGRRHAGRAHPATASEGPSTWSRSSASPSDAVRDAGRGCDGHDRSITSACRRSTCRSAPPSGRQPRRAVDMRSGSAQRPQPACCRGRHAVTGLCSPAATSRAERRAVGLRARAHVDVRRRSTSRPRRASGPGRRSARRGHEVDEHLDRPQERHLEVGVGVDAGQHPLPALPRSRPSRAPRRRPPSTACPWARPARRRCRRRPASPPARRRRTGGR